MAGVGRTCQYSTEHDRECTERGADNGVAPVAAQLLRGFGAPCNVGRGVEVTGGKGVGRSPDNVILDHDVVRSMTPACTGTHALRHARAYARQAHRHTGAQAHRHTGACAPHAGAQYLTI